MILNWILKKLEVVEIKMSRTMVYKGTLCNLRVGKYLNKNTAIELVSTETAEIKATATSNLDEVLPEGQVYIKDYSENEGMLEALQQEGIIGDIISVRRSGFVQIPVCTLLIK
jgi:hypothetical protein